MPKSKRTWDDKEKLNFVFSVLRRTADLQRPNFHVLADELDFSSANDVQKKWRRFINEAGFELAHNQIFVKGEEPEKTTITVPSPASKASAPKSSTTKKTATKESPPKTPAKTQGKETGPSAKKRKVEIVEISDDEEEVEVETGTGEAIKEEVNIEDALNAGLLEAESETDPDTEDEAEGSATATDINGDGPEINDDGDRFRRSGRSMTLLPKVENTN